MRPRRVLVSGLCALALAATSIPGAVPAGAAVDPAGPDALSAFRAVTWLESQQQEDGGFELAGGFLSETIDVVLAVGAEAQTTSTWSAAQALRAVLDISTEDGVTALDFLDDLADATGDDRLRPATAAKLISSVSVPLCLSSTRFDPQGDGATDLVARMKEIAGPDGSYAAPGELNATLFAVLALVSLGEPVPAAAVETIRDAQKRDGSYHYSGDPAPGQFDFDDYDTTSLAIQALVAAGVAGTDPAVADAVDFLLERQNENGSWDAFGSADPNATAIAGLGLRAAGRQPEHDDKAWLRSQQQSDGRIASPSDSFGVNTYATSQTARALVERPLPVRAAADSCPGQGYYLFAADGGVFAFGGSRFYGSMGGTTLNSPIVNGSVTPTGRGYHLFAADGGVFSFGDASFHGSMGGRRLNSPIVAGASTPTGRGYVLFAADGGVFTFGDARFYGSMGATRLNEPIIAAATTPSGNGYVMVARDGGVFTFGDAPFKGSLGGTPLNQPVLGGAVTRTGEGYLLFARDGGVFTFGDADFEGSLGAIRLNQPIVAGGIGALGSGYAMFAADGGVFTFGDVAFVGSAGSLKLNSPVVGGAID